MPSDKQKATNQSEMLEEGIRGHETIVARRQLPEAKGNQCCDQRKASERKGCKPPVETDKDHHRGAQLESNHGDGDRKGGRKAEVLYLSNCAAEIGRLDEPALQIGRA